LSGTKLPLMPIAPSPPPLLPLSPSSTSQYYILLGWLLHIASMTALAIVGEPDISSLVGLVGLPSLLPSLQSVPPLLSPPSPYFFVLCAPSSSQLTQHYHLVPAHPFPPSLHPRQIFLSFLGGQIMDLSQRALIVQRSRHESLERKGVLMVTVNLAWTWGNMLGREGQGADKSGPFWSRSLGGARSFRRGGRGHWHGFGGAGWMASTFCVLLHLSLMFIDIHPSCPLSQALCSAPFATRATFKTGAE
jgi:hypothetical protein